MDRRIDACSKVEEPRAAYSDQLNDAQLRGEFAGLLHQQVAAMNLNNFVVRPQRKSVEKFAKFEAWNKLGTDSFTELADKVAGLLTALLDNDEDAKRFDMLVLRTQLAILQARPDFAALRERMQAIASALEEQDAIPAIKAHMVLIQAIAGDEWWEGMTVAMLESARKKLRALVRLIEKGKQVVVYTDFEDALGEGAAIALPGVGLSTLRTDCERAKSGTGHSHIAAPHVGTS